MSLPYYRIDLQEVPEAIAANRDEVLRITVDSAVKMRRIVERFALYFKREFSYDFVQFSANDTSDDDPYVAYLFTNEYNGYPRVWAGACCFRQRDYKDVGPRWAMQWMWLHPYFRSRGILGRAWPKFHEHHGNFYCEPPLSRAMEAFVRKQGKCVVCWQKLDAPEGAICVKCQKQHESGRQNCAR